MEPVRPALAPGRPDTREAMCAQQRQVAALARFTDDRHAREPIAGVDQAVPDGRAVSAVVTMAAGAVTERVRAETPLELPYVPGLLSFREGPSIVAALGALEDTPALVLFDGSGRIHMREAGIATHIGVCFDVPAVGVAKGLLCGEPTRSVEGLAAGECVPIEADGEMTAPTGTVVGYAVQTRQFDAPGRHVNPVYVSPGHRVSPETAARVVLACCDGYKLPEPIRLADAHAGSG